MSIQWFAVNESECLRLNTFANRPTSFSVHMPDGSLRDFERPLTVSNKEDHQHISVYVMFNYRDSLGFDQGTFFLYLKRGLALSITETQDRSRLIIPGLIPLTEATRLS